MNFNYDVWIAQFDVVTSVFCYFFTTVRVPMLLSIMPFPVLRSMMSKIISKSEQGECVQRSYRAVSVCLYNLLRSCLLHRLYDGASNQTLQVCVPLEQSATLELFPLVASFKIVFPPSCVCLCVCVVLCFCRSPVCLSFLSGEFNQQRISRSLQQRVCRHGDMVLRFHLSVVRRTLCHSFVCPRVSSSCCQCR